MELLGAGSTGLPGVGCSGLPGVGVTGFLELYRQVCKRKLRSYRLDDFTSYWVGWRPSPHPRVVICRLPIRKLYHQQ